MSGPATAIPSQSNLIAPHHPSDPINAFSTSSDHFAAASTPRGQVNAWGWPSGFNQPPSTAAATHSTAGPGKSPASAIPASSNNMYNPPPQQQQSLQQAQQHNQPPLHQQIQSQNASTYPPQPYANSSAYSAANHSTTSPTPNMSAIAMSKKRTASNSPDLDAKDKRLRPDYGANADSKTDSKPAAAVDGRAWGEEATKLDVYVWDYLTRRGFTSAAKALMGEAGMAESPEVPLKTPQGLLFEYWAIFWDVFAARSGRGGSEAAAYFEYQESRNMQRLAEANRKVEMLEANYQPPDNSGRFPNIVAPNHSADGQADGRTPNQQAAWNPAALPPGQQQQLLIAAAQRQNIPLHEIKNLSPASRMALINSMNPNNPMNGQAIRPPMGNQSMEQQLQARLQQQQNLHRMMQQQQRQGSGHGGPIPPPGLAGGPQIGGSMQVRPAGPHPSMSGPAGSPATPTPGGIPDGRRSVGPPGQGPESGRPDHLQGMPPGLQQSGGPLNQGGPQGTPQPGQQHPQLSQQQQQLVMNQFQGVQAAMREEWMKAQSAPNQASAADFYNNVQAYQAKAQGLQNLLRAQANFQSNAPGTDPGVPSQAMQGQQGGPMMPGGQPGQPRPPHMMMGPGNGGIPNPNSGSPAVLHNLTPQQRAAQIANAQAAAGRITPAMATHDPGLMATMIGPNGAGARASTPQHPGGTQGNEHQGGPSGMHGGPQQNHFQQQGPRPSSAQGRPDDSHLAHFSAAQMASSPANMQRPGMQRSASSQLGAASGGMGPPGASIMSHSPHLQANNLQPQPGTQGGSPASAAVTSTPKLGSAEKVKKANARQRKNSKATNSKTPTLTAASVPASTAGTAAVNSSNGGATASTPVATNAATPVSGSAATPGRDAGNRQDGAQSASQQQTTSQPQEPSMPPPSGPLNSSNEVVSQMDGAQEDQGASSTDAGNGATGAPTDDFMYGFGGSMNDIFDFDLSTDAVGAQGMGGDTWDSNFGNLFAGSGSGQADSMSGGN